MARDTIQLENAVSTISQEYLLEFTSEYGIPEGLHPELPGLEETIVDFSKGKVVQTTRKKHPTVLYKTPGLLEKLEQPIFFGGQEDISHHRGPAYKRSEGWDASSELVFRGGRDSTGHTPYPHPKTTKSPVMPNMDLFNLISAPNPTKVKTKTRPRPSYEVLLLTVTTSRVIDMEDVAVASESLGTPSTIEKSPLEFANEDQPQTITEAGGAEDQVQDEVAYEIPPTGNTSTTGVALETGLEKEVAAMGPHVNKRRRKRGNNEAEANAPPKVLRRDHDAFPPAQSTHRGKSLASIRLDAGSLIHTCCTGPFYCHGKYMKKAAEAKNAELSKELDSLHVIGHGMRLAVIKCAESSKIRQAFADVVSARLAKGMSEGLKYGIENGKAGRDLADVKAYDPESNIKLVKSIQDLKDLKYPMVDQLEKLKHASMELIM
nr:hypothetical protein [Tanacetum cinerariifolium]